jgi:hypothetical protein
MEKMRAMLPHINVSNSYQTMDGKSVFDNMKPAVIANNWVQEIATVATPLPFERTTLLTVPMPAPVPTPVGEPMLHGVMSALPIDDLGQGFPSHGLFGANAPKVDPVQSKLDVFKR